MTKEKEPIHYVDNKKFTKAVIEYADSVRYAKLNDLEEPQISNYIGISVKKIADGLASRPNFSSYSYKDEMISDGLENVFQYLYNFDPVKQDITKICCNLLNKQTIKSEKEAIKYLKGVMPIKEFEFELMSSKEKVLERFEILTEEEFEEFFSGAYKRMKKPKFSLERMNSIKTANAFAYVSQMIYFAFLRRIDKEHKQQHIKEKQIQQAGVQTMLYCTQPDDDRIYYNSQIEMLKNDSDSDYEDKKKDKKK